MAAISQKGIITGEVTRGQGFHIIRVSGQSNRLNRNGSLAKRSFTVPLVGYLPLNIIPVAIIIILLILLHEWYLRKKETPKSQVKPGKKNKQKK